jgi:hypothetical protein
MFLIVNFNHVEGLMLMTTDLDAGVLLFSATWFTGTKTFASGKYVAAQFRGIS